MAKSYRQKRSRCQRGFSLAELMVATVVLLVVIGGVLQLLSQSQQRYVSTANVEDSTAMAREAVDLMARDLRLAGYPPPSSYPDTVIVAGTNEQYIAGAWNGTRWLGGGFLAASDYAVQFEADIGIPPACDGVTLPLTDYRCTSGTGVVSVIDYQLQVPSGGATGGCAGLTEVASLTSATLMRSQVPKNANGTPVTPVFTPFVSDVLNCGAGIPIFIRCRQDAVVTGCPNLSGQPPSTLPAPRNTRAVLIRLLVQTRNRDPQTGQFQVVDFYNVAERLNPDF